jgi:hypothetical protein
MTIDYSEDGHVRIDMTNYIKNILREVPPGMRGKATTPASSYLFETNQHVIAFLSTKVKDPNGDDLKNLCRKLVIIQFAC